MSFTSEVSAFMDTLGPFYESVEKEEEGNQISLSKTKNNQLPLLEYADKEDNLDKEQLTLPIAANESDPDLPNRSELNAFDENDTSNDPLVAERDGNDDSYPGIHTCYSLM